METKHITEKDIEGLNYALDLLDKNSPDLRLKCMATDLRTALSNIMKLSSNGAQVVFEDVKTAIVNLMSDPEAVLKNRPEKMAA